MIPVVTDRIEAAAARASGGWRKIKTLQLPLTYAEDCDEAGLSDRAFRLHVSATFKTSRYGMREPIDTPVVRRCVAGTEAELASAVQELVAGGMWEELGEGVWIIVHDLPSQREQQPWDSPNATDGTWEGLIPLARDGHAPPPGTPVVYRLHDSDGLCYIGSTMDLRTRLDAHCRDGKLFEAWTARRCATRQAAFAEEWAAIAEHRPHLNRLQPK